MKYSIIIVSSLIAGAFAHPQASATITPAPSVASGLSPAQTCIASCPAGDVNCQAACVGAAHPNSSQVVDTTQCAMKCDQGDGSPAATEKYSQCVQGCIASYFPTSQTVAAAAGSQAASVSGSQASEATGKSATGTKATGSAASGTATGATASSSTGAANVHAQMGAGAAGFAGFLMAIFAL